MNHDAILSSFFQKQKRFLTLVVAQNTPDCEKKKNKKKTIVSFVVVRNTPSEGTTNT